MVNAREILLKRALCTTDSYNITFASRPNGHIPTLRMNEGRKLAFQGTLQLEGSRAKWPIS